MGMEGFLLEVRCCSPTCRGEEDSRQEAKRL